MPSGSSWLPGTEREENSSQLTSREKTVTHALNPLPWN